MCIVDIQVNYPSASSPTETLLRLLLSLNNQVESSFRLHTSPKTLINYPICSSMGGVSKDALALTVNAMGNNKCKLQTLPKGVSMGYPDLWQYLIVIEALIYKWFVFFLYNCLDWQLVDCNSYFCHTYAITVCVKNNYYCLGTNPPETEEPGPSGLFFFSALPLRCV